MHPSRPILVTGANGFLALHTILLLLKEGYKVRGTLRDFAHEMEVRDTMKKHGGRGDSLEFVPADLMEDTGWETAVDECENVLHIASPFPLFEPAHEEELIVPAVHGTLRVLQASQNAHVKRVVVVSSNASISSGHTGEDRTFDENDWSDIEKDIGPYARSKTLAERAAWEFINSPRNTRGLELAVVNPPLILGPVLNRHYSTSAEVIRTLMLGQVPGVAKIKMGIVDAQDVAQAILLAMTTPEAAGNRFACPATTLWIKDIADILHRAYASRGYRIPRTLFPSFAARAIALFDRKVARLTRDLDWDFELSNEKIRRVLKWEPRFKEQAILSMADSMIEQGIL